MEIHFKVLLIVPEDWRWPYTKLVTKVMRAKMTVSLANVLNLRNTRSTTGNTNFKEKFASMQSSYRLIVLYCCFIPCNAGPDEPLWALQTAPFESVTL